MNSINWARVMAQVVYYVTTVGPARAAARSRCPPATSATSSPAGSPSGWGSPIDQLVIALEQQRHPHPLGRRRVAGGRAGRAHLQPVHGHPGVVQPRAAAVRAVRARRRPHGRAARRASAGIGVGGGAAQPIASTPPASTTPPPSPRSATSTTRTGVLVDPHTAVGIGAARACDAAATRRWWRWPPPTRPSSPTPSSRPPASGPPLPERLADLLEREERYDVLPNDARRRARPRGRGRRPDDSDLAADPADDGQRSAFGGPEHMAGALHVRAPPRSADLRRHRTRPWPAVVATVAPGHRRRARPRPRAVGHRPRTATIHPGVQMFTDGAQCTANFIFTDGTEVLIGYAAHCAGTGAATDTNGCTARTLAARHPRGDRWRRREPGTLVYSSWVAMQAVGETDADTCAYNDFALVKIDPADVGQGQPVDPALGRSDRTQHQRQPGAGPRLHLRQLEPAPRPHAAVAQDRREPGHHRRRLDPPDVHGDARASRATPGSALPRRAGPGERRPVDPRHRRRCRCSNNFSDLEPRRWSTPADHGQSGSERSRTAPSPSTAASCRSASSESPARAGGAQ